MGRKLGGRVRGGGGGGTGMEDETDEGVEVEFVGENAEGDGGVELDMGADVWVGVWSADIGGVGQDGGCEWAEVVGVWSGEIGGVG